MTTALVVAACLQVSGRAWVTPAVRAPGVTQHRLASKAARTEVSYHVFLPHDYESKPKEKFPVLIWLHGSGGGLAGIGPVSGFFDAAMRAGKVPSMILVFPNSFANGMWCDSVDGQQPIETIVIRELIPEVDRKFRTHARRESRLVEGFSMGGYGAGRFGFKFPQMFAGVSMLAAGPLDLEFKGPKTEQNPKLRENILHSVFGGSLEKYQAQSPWKLAETNAPQLRSGPKIRICIGERDFTLPANRTFSEHLTSLKIPHEFTTRPGVGHDTLALLRALGEDNWKFYQSALKE
ncbi:MAG TPA: alpha/beta hydrolase-fold protein [Fimbriimonadaceae bacterium]|mgnify:CR=1 FL=1|nr:alpha/beta hydrolase-fold protein [Fimbriimonadaceae bacterium]HRJ32769.1 alpha/beta hydrolase-fold protein [Fimbriimonadaceae bacterium]